MPTSIRTRRLAAGTASERGLLDTSVVIALGTLRVARIPFACAVSALTLAELNTGAVVAEGGLERARRHRLAQRAESTFETLPFDSACACAYGPIYAAVASRGRKPRGSRAIDQMIAATALAHDLPLYTCNPRDIEGLDGLIQIVDLS